MTLIDNEKYFGVVKDEYLITIPSSDETKNGKSKPESAASVLDHKANKAYPTIAWSESPQMLVWDEPYLLGLVTDAVEVRVLDTSGLDKDNLIQTIPELQKARFLISGKSGQQG